MSIKYLAIDKDIAVHEREKVYWNKRGIADIRVDSMTKGIEKAVESQFVYIVINADNINYLPELKILREATNDPILIGTSTFTVQAQVEALHNGADFYGKFSEFDDNMKAALAVISRVDERAKQRKPPIKLLTYGNILITPAYRQTYVNDAEVELTKNEFDMLYYFMNNRGRVLSYEQIYRNIWNSEYNESVNEVIKVAIKRLRKKIVGEENDNSLIVNVRGVGYKLPVKFKR